MAYRDRSEHLSTAEAIERLRLDTLRPLAKLIDADAPSRKQDIVPFLSKRLAREDVVRRLYESLDEINQAAVQEALKAPGAGWIPGDSRPSTAASRSAVPSGRRPRSGC